MTAKMNQPERTMNQLEGDLSGRIVLVTGGYPSGEYFVVSNTRHSLTGVKLGVGYDFHDLKNISFAPGQHGSQNLISDVYDDDAMARRLACENEEWARSALSGKEKRQWVESVYTQASATARIVLRVLDKKPRPKTIPNSSTTYIARADFEAAAETIRQAARMGQLEATSYHDINFTFRSGEEIIAGLEERVARSQAQLAKAETALISAKRDLQCPVK
jgi:hypothetical protein